MPSQPMHPTPQAVRIWHNAQAERCKAIYLDSTLVLGPKHVKALVHWHNSHSNAIARH